MLKGFREFILRGNVIDLAVAAGVLGALGAGADVVSAGDDDPPSGAGLARLSLR